MYTWYSTGSTTVISSCQPTMTHRSRMLYMYQDCLFLSNIYQSFSSVCNLKNIKARNLILPWKPCCLSFLFLQVLHENSGHLLTKCYLLNLFLHIVINKIYHKKIQPVYNLSVEILGASLWENRSLHGLLITSNNNLSDCIKVLIQFNISKLWFVNKIFQYVAFFVKAGDTQYELSFLIFTNMIIVNSHGFQSYFL